MIHYALILYILCYVTDFLTIIISLLLYRKLQHKAFHYLALLMTGAFLSMLIDAFWAYDQVILPDLSLLRRTAYLILEPVSELMQFLMLPMLAFAAVGRTFPRRLNRAAKIYALAFAATFPIEAVTDKNSIMVLRETAGFFVFHIFAYLIILTNYKRVTNGNLIPALKSYLIFGIVFVPLGILFQIGLSSGFIHPKYPEVPFLYLYYCILFNILCLVNAFRYLFVPVQEKQTPEPGGLFARNHITSREQEIIFLVLQGLTNQQIGRKLFISARTVKNHIYSIYRKTGARNRMQLANKIGTGKMRD